MNTIKFLTIFTILILIIFSPTAFASIHTFKCNLDGKCTGNFIEDDGRHFGVGPFVTTEVLVECSPWSRHPLSFLSTNVDSSSSSLHCDGWGWIPSYPNKSYEDCINWSFHTHYLTITEITC